jgi:hypothetical protein
LPESPESPVLPFHLFYWTTRYPIF